MKAITFCTYLDNDSTLWKQTWYMSKGRCYLSEGTYNVKNLEPITPIYDGKDTGLDFLPVILFPNNALSGNLFGTSYLRDLVPLFDQYNRSMSDAADSLRFNMFAITVLLNAPPDAEKMVKVSPGEVWNVGGEGVDAKKLESSFQYSQALADFLTRLENLMHLIGEVPDITPERIKGFGLVSGVALKLLYGDLVSSTQQSWRIWKSRLQQANEYTLRMLETYAGSDGFPYKFNIKDIGGSYDNRIIDHLPLPYNEAEKINMEIQKLSANLQSMTGALRELGEKYPERKLAEILAERMKMMELGDGGFNQGLAMESKNLLAQEKPVPNPEGING
jgi:SPP1 family phage portal protein